MSTGLQKVEVTCPHCRHQQKEPAGVISTVCRHCYQNFRVQPLPQKKVARLAKETREVCCFSCGHEQNVVASAMSAQCERCSTYLNFRNYQITDESRETLQTFGMVVFAPGCDYRGAPVRADKIELRGRAQSKLWAGREIIVGAQAIAPGNIKTPLLRVEPKTRASLGRIEVDELTIEGFIKMEEAIVRKRLWVKSTGTLVVKRIELMEAQVDLGGGLEGKVILRPEWEEEISPSPKQESSTEPTLG